MDQYFLSIYPFLVYALKISIGSYVPQLLLHLLFHTEIGWNQVNFKFHIIFVNVMIKNKSLMTLT